MTSAADAASVLDRLRAGMSALWINPQADGPEIGATPPGIDVTAAEHRMERAVPLLHALFPETANARQPISSPLQSADKLARSLGSSRERDGQWLVKADHRLPVAGSIKARGGFHEVIAIAERLAVQQGMMREGGDLTSLTAESARALFARHSIVVGSTGNLGMAIGLMSSALGFRAVVHMSRDAKEWKKQRLRDAGATVVEHLGDYLNAVAQGREQARADPRAHFVDDERSTDLFNGYAVAARELKSQLDDREVSVDADHPLFVYIPCGVGGAPGGISFGLKELFGTNVRCFFAEPVHAPCMLVQMASGSNEPISIADVGLDGRTQADGLAVGQASMLVAPLMRSRVTGIHAVTDDQLLVLLRHAFDSEGLMIEPSAAAGIAGPLALTRSLPGRELLARAGLAEKLTDSCHVIWTTGGALVPPAEQDGYIARARTVSANVAFSDD